MHTHGVLGVGLEIRLSLFTDSDIQAGSIRETKLSIKGVFQNPGLMEGSLFLFT